MPRRGSDDEYGGGGGDDGGNDAVIADVNTAAAQVVRLALFHEYRRAPLKRQTIRSVIPNKINFNAVFARAQQTLAATFGMQLVELRARHKGDVAEERAEEAAATQAATQAPAQTERRKGKGRAREGDDDEDEEEEEEEGEADAEGSRPRGKKRAKTGTYVLRNILPPKIVAAMSNPVPLPIFDEEDAAYTEANAADSGALIPWEKADAGNSPELLGIRTVILCLILTMGRSADDLRLMSFLRRLGLQRDTLLPFGSPDGHHPHMTLEKFMDFLAKQNYLEKVKVQNPSAPEGVSIEWRWGSRETEFSEEAALAFIERIFLDPDSSGEDTDSDGETRRPDRNGRRRPRTEQEKKARFERKRKTLREDVERAAGGALVGEL